MTSANLADVKIIDTDGPVRDRDANIRKFMEETHRRRQRSLLRNNVWDASMDGKLGLVGITVGNFGMNEHTRQPMFRPIYEELQKLNAPLLIHNSRREPAGETRYDTFLFRHTIGRRFKTLLDCAALMYAACRRSFPSCASRFWNAATAGLPIG